MNAVSSLVLVAILSAGGDPNSRLTPPIPVPPASSPATNVTLLQFTSKSCQYCQAMQPLVAQLAQQGASVQAIDVDQQRQVAQQFRVSGVPTFVAVSGGREVGRIEGVTDYEKLAALAQGSRVRVQGSVAESGVGSRGSGVGGQVVPTNFQAPVPSTSSPELTARAVTVRIRVEDATGYGYGTGTIIDVHDNEALVITCGHLFRESKGQGKVTADVFATGTAQTVDGQLIGYDLDRDVALIGIRAGGLQPATVAPPVYTVRPGDRAFTMGCDKGADPSVRATQITAVNKYRGRPNYTAAGQPADGRSGGGLFSADGYLIGICNAADPADNEGIYAGLASIHWQLDRIGQSEIYQRAAVAAAGRESGGGSRGTEIRGQGTGDRGQATAGLPSNGSGGSVVPASFAAPATDLAPIAAAGDDTEIVFIVRSKRDPAQRSDVYVVDQAPPDLLARITHAARASGEQRAALARAPQPQVRTARNQLPVSPPVVRGQTGEY